MSDTLTPLILDFLEWIAREPRTYADVMDAWRTSCPRLTVWEDAVDRGFVLRRRDAGELIVDVTPAGRRLLRDAGRIDAPLADASLAEAPLAEAPLADALLGVR